MPSAHSRSSRRKFLKTIFKNLCSSPPGGWGGRTTAGPVDDGMSSALAIFFRLFRREPTIPPRSFPPAPAPAPSVLPPALMTPDAQFARTDRTGATFHTPRHSIYAGMQFLSSSPSARARAGAEESSPTEPYTCERCECAVT